MAVAVTEIVAGSGSGPYLKIPPLLAAMRPIAAAVRQLEAPLRLRRDRPVVLLDILAAAPQ